MTRRRDDARIQRTAVVIAVALATLILGYLGYQAAPGEDLSVLDAAYQSVRLFSLEVDPAGDGLPWQLEIARFLAPLVLVYATVATVLALLRDRVESARVRLFARDHVIVLGGGPEAEATVEALRGIGRRVVLVAPAPQRGATVALRGLGARVLVRDPTHAGTAAAAGLHRARELVIVTGADDRNLEALAASFPHHPQRRASPPRHVAIDDVASWRELTRIALSEDAEGPPIEFFNAADRAAQIVADAAVHRCGQLALQESVIDGAGALAERLVVHLARRARVMGIAPRFLVTAPSLESLRARLAESEPWCLQAGETAEFDERRVDDAPQPAVGFVCGDGDDAARFGRAARLARTVAEIDWFVAAKRPRAAVALERLPMRSDRVHLVSAGLPALARDLFTHSGLEIIARARHADYVHQELSRQGADGGNPSLVEWERLPESLKDSNRRFAQSVGSAVGELGGALRPLTAAPTGADLDLPAERLEELAQREHERWMRDLQRDGWRATDGAKDPHGKRHPLLVPWESLSEHEREKDRDSVRGLPRMLSLVGYELVMPEQESRRQPVE